MPIGLGTGLAIAGAATAAGAGINALAVNSAANKQAAGTSQALNLQQQMYNQTRADLSPYAQVGTAALGNLRQLTGLPAATPQIPQSTMPGGAPGQTGPIPGVASVPFNQNGAPMNSGIGPQAQPGTPSTPSQLQSPAQMQTSSGYVTMRAKDGTIAQVDPAHVARATQLGAQVVSQ